MTFSLLHLIVIKCNKEQEGHGGPGLLTWVSCEPRIFKLTDFGIKQAQVIILTNCKGTVSSF